MTLLPFLLSQTSRLVARPTRQTVAFAFRVQDPKVDILAACNALASPKAPLEDRQFALYQRARWHHREYELAAKGSAYLLKEVIPAYGRYLDQYRSMGPYPSEARFYQAIAFLEGNNTKAALAAVAALRPTLDPTIDLDDIVWTPRREFSVRSAYDASALRDVLLASIRRNLATPPPARVEAVARELRAWVRPPTAQ